MSEIIKKDTFVQTQKKLYKSVSPSNSSRKTHLYIPRKSCTNLYLCRIHQERHICTDAERPVQMCISVEFIKKDTFVQVQKELYKCVSLSNSSRKTQLYRCRKSCTNVYLCRIHQERHNCTDAEIAVQISVRITQERPICTDAERAVQMCISVEFMKKDTFVQPQKELYKCVSLSKFIKKTNLYRHRKSCTNEYLCRIHQERHICTGAERVVEIYVRIHQERNICTHAGRGVQMCISVRIHQEKHICTDEERPVSVCISVEFIKKDTFVHSKKVLSKCVSLSNSSRKTHLYRRRKTCTNVYFCRVHEEGHICTAAERAVQMCISVQIHQERQICTDAETALQMCIPVEFIKKDTFAQTQKELYKCVSLSNSSRKTPLYRRRNSCTNLCPNSSRKTHLYRRRKSYTNVHLCPNSSRKTHLYRRKKS